MTTSITQLLVHTDATAQAPRRREAACRLAQQAGGAVVAPLRDIDDERRKSTRARFDQVSALMAH